ncbi:hypothetical protein AA313_de0203033 [Arthrobotrys entomopaga]|nr:hypothetical protein AA313_de0203033 [Arthrobotrys entomopaga]
MDLRNCTYIHTALVRVCMYVCKYVMYMYIRVKVQCFRYILCNVCMYVYVQRPSKSFFFLSLKHAVGGRGVGAPPTEGCMYIWYLAAAYANRDLCNSGPLRDLHLANQMAKKSTPYIQSTEYILRKGKVKK